MTSSFEVGTHTHSCLSTYTHPVTQDAGLCSNVLRPNFLSTVRGAELNPSYLYLSAGTNWSKAGTNLAFSLNGQSTLAPVTDFTNSHSRSCFRADTSNKNKKVEGRIQYIFFTQGGRSRVWIQVLKVDCGYINCRLGFVAVQTVVESSKKSVVDCIMLLI